MEKQSKRWVEEQNEDIVTSILRDDFHAVNFDVDGVHYCFAGWWSLCTGDGDNDEDYKIYDSKEEFLKDPVFDGKTLAEVNPVNVYVDLE